jgi:hypothetical protein
MGKKMGVAQKIGDIGELIFEQFAVKNDLIPNKVKRDYGIDYVCQPTEYLSAGIRSVRATFLGVNVRSSAQRRVRAKYTKEDLMQILKSDFPTLLILVDVNNEVVFYRFLDMELLDFFHDEIVQGKQTVTLAPVKMNRNTEELPKFLAQIMEPRYQERLRLRGIELRLSQIIGSVRLRLQRSSGGSFAVVEVRNFEDIFKHQEERIKSKVREVILTSRLDRGFSLPTEHINRALDAEIGPLVDKIAVITKVPSKMEKLIVNNQQNIVESIFEVRNFGDEFSFYHQSGLCIIFSGPRKGEDGLYYHHFAVKYDDPSSEPLFSHKDIVDFLKNCVDNATLFLGDIGKVGFDMKYFPMLIKLGLIVKSLEKIYEELNITALILRLYHIDDHNFQITFGFLSNLFNPYATENIWPGFVIAPENVQVKWVGGKIFCPVFLTLPEGMFIIMVSFNGKIGLTEGTDEKVVIGFRLDKYLGMTVEEFHEPSDKPIALPKIPLMLIGGNMAIEIRGLDDGDFHKVKSPFNLGISYNIEE